MDEVSSQLWFLRKYQDGAVFGPISFDQLAAWASAAQVAPHDLVSTDQLAWLKAPMIPQLAMDWLVEVTSEHLYGPTTVGAIQEFIRLGDINADKVFFGAAALSFRKGVMNYDADMPRAFLHAGKQRILAMDSSKLGLEAVYRLCPVESCDLVITDSGVKPADLARLRKLTKVLVAK